MAFSFFGFWYEIRKKMTLAWRSFWNYSPNRWYFFIIIVLNIILWFFAYRIFVLSGSELFVFHYSVRFGIDNIGSATKVFQIPALVSGISIFNFVSLLKFRRQGVFHFLSHATGLTSMLIHFLAGLALMSLYLINFLA